jgi:hypothetical protein
MQRTSAKQSQFRVGHGRAIVPNKANSRRSFKCEVSSVKSGKPGGQSPESSYLKLHTLHSKPGRRPFVQNEANSRPADRHELHVTLGDSLHRARGMAQIIADVSARIGVQPGRTDARTELSVPA